MNTTDNAIAIKIDQTLTERINRFAATRQRSPEWLMCEAVTAYMDREEKREAYQRDGVAAWNNFQASGLHATFDEADAWLAELETGLDAPPPACHG